MVLVLKQYLRLLLYLNKESNEEYIDVLENLKQDFMNEKSEFRALKFWILKHHKNLVKEN